MCVALSTLTPSSSGLTGGPDAEIKDRVDRAARTLRIEHLLDRKT
ncbi:MAG: ABC transporter ATP-binding protein, partial [Mesorhizobium sp.]